MLPSQSGGDWRRLDELGPGADDGYDFYLLVSQRCKYSRSKFLRLKKSFLKIQMTKDNIQINFKPKSTMTQPGLNFEISVIKIYLEFGI